jgi:putative acetyltransferase
VSVILREEAEGDRAAVVALIDDAFAGRPYASGTEALLPAALHEAGAATVALVAEDEGRILGQALFSPVTIDGRPSSWHGLGPVAVAPHRQRQGIGSALILEGLARLKALGSEGCVVEGDGAYYGRFGLRRPERLQAPGLPAEFVFVLPFAEEPQGAVGFHPAFSS